MRTILALMMLAPQQPVEYADAMKKVSAKFTGKEGVVIHVGDSITYANPYSSWARGGQGKTPEDQAICKWMHVGEDNDSDGYFLARVDRPGGRSDTAVSGIRSDEYLQGGKAGIPPLAEVVKKYNPQIAVVLLGTNDVSAGYSAAQYKANMTRVVDTILANNTIPVVTTIPPYKGKDEVVKAFNAALMELVREKKIPVIDYCGEILKRRPKDWMGTLISEDGVHPSVGPNAAGAPTEENLKSSGYLLRCVLSVRKVAEVKARAVDGVKRK